MYSLLAFTATSKIAMRRSRPRPFSAHQARPSSILLLQADSSNAAALSSSSSTTKKTTTTQTTATQTTVVSVSEVVTTSSDAIDDHLKDQTIQNQRKTETKTQQHISGTKNSNNTGGLRRLPVLRGPTELIHRAKRAALRVQPNRTIQVGKKRAHKHGAVRLTMYTQELCRPLRESIDGYRYVFRNLHPFEQVVADLTIRSRQKKDGLTLSIVLEELNEARKLLLEASKDWIAKVKQAETAQQAGNALDEGMERLTELFDTMAAPSVTDLVDLQKGLRHAPVIQLDAPAVVLVGAPNVGKSSIVRYISSASPEVNNYPFTTRGMTLGHVQVYWSENSAIVKALIPESNSNSTSSRHRRTKQQPNDVDDDNVTGQHYAFTELCQVMDSPGLLLRSEEEQRNEMEALTLAALQHLPTAVCYVLDLTGAAGSKCSSVADQLALRREVRARFPRRPWIDVVSKVDLGVVDGALQELDEILAAEGRTVPPPIQLSIHDNIGIEELRAEILRMLGEVRIVLDAMVTVEDINVQ